jgi:hypothetical protein
MCSLTLFSPANPRPKKSLNGQAAFSADVGRGCEALHGDTLRNLLAVRGRDDARYLSS